MSLLPKPHRHLDHFYYQYDQVTDQYPLLKRGCKTGKKFLEKYGIDESRICYAKLVDSTWIITRSPNQRHKLFIRSKDILNLISDLPERVPNDIDLRDEEMFHNVDGDAVEIHVVGKRLRSKCYFSVADIMKAFEMKYLDDTIMDARKSYERNVHYKIFDNTEQS